jgi:uncharacterized repeat protein (TIGR03803 family)
MSKLSWWRTICLVCVFCAVAVIASPAQTFTNLLFFDGTDGRYPAAPLIQGTDGNLYGTTSSGGAHSEAYGTVFKITAEGKTTRLYSFCSKSGCADGSYPAAGLVLATDGNFYGTTPDGGANGEGTVFRITPAGTLTTLHSFCAEKGCSDGYEPAAGLVQAANGNFYGTTEFGGVNGRGTVFEITAGGKLTTLYSFCAETNCTDGSQPVAGLVQAINGNFYGTTYSGGADGIGTVFEITTGGKLTTLHSFDGSDGERPQAGLVQATNGTSTGQPTLAGPTALAQSLKSQPGAH